MGHSCLSTTAATDAQRTRSAKCSSVYTIPKQTIHITCVLHSHPPRPPHAHPHTFPPHTHFPETKESAHPPGRLLHRSLSIARSPSGVHRVTLISSTCASGMVRRSEGGTSPLICTKQSTSSLATFTHTRTHACSSIHLGREREGMNRHVRAWVVNVGDAESNGSSPSQARGGGSVTVGRPGAWKCVWGDGRTSTRPRIP